MAENDAKPLDRAEGPEGRTIHDKIFRATWIYLRGWVVILVVFLLAVAVGKAYSQVAEWLEPLSRWASSAQSRFLAISILVVVPWAVGKFSELLVTGSLVRTQRGLRAYQTMERRLSTEFKADRHHGYRVALVNSPSTDNRTLGLIVADFSEPETGRELVAVFLPNTPDPTGGNIRVVAAEEVQMTDWDLSDLARFHVTFGSAAPDLTDLDE